MIFFRKKKPKPPAKKETVKKEIPPSKEKSFQEIIHSRILTAEGWKRFIEKKGTKKK